jgi:predicted alpha/beta hydrolase family esterase
LPGIGGSGPRHWHTLWEAANQRFSRFAPASWDEPILDEWCSALDAAVDHGEAPVVLVAHSLTCLLVAHWAARTGGTVAGALLVSVPDPSGPRFPRAARSFEDVPDMPLAFPTLIIASLNDPYGAIEHSRRRGEQWGSSVIEVGQLGHINTESGVGEWAEGRRLLDAFTAGLSLNL